MSLIPSNTMNRDLLNVATNGDQGNPNVIHEALLHVMQNNTSATYRFLKVISLDVIQDFENNITDEITLKGILTPGIWTDKILPFVDTLEITLIRPNKKPKRYKAYCKTPKDYRKETSALQGATTEDMDRMTIIELEFQLIPRLIEKLMTVQVGTNIIQAKMDDALKALVYRETNRITGLADADKLHGLDYVPSDNQEKYQHLPIPHNTRLIDLPNFFQNKLYGLYKHHIGSYIHENEDQQLIWYIYPLLNSERNDPLVRYINIFVSKRDYFSYTEKTYWVKDKDINILAALQKESLENNTAKMLNGGNGIRLPNQMAYGTKNALDVKDNIPKVNRNQVIHELNVFDSPNKNNYAPLNIDGNDSKNIYQQISNAAWRMGTMYAVTWQHSNYQIIKPGCIVRIHYTGENNEQKIMQGVVLRIHHFVQAMTNNIGDKNFNCTSVLTIFCKEKHIK